jgi:hypothetical protein
LQDLQELKWHVHLETRTLNKVLGELRLVGNRATRTYGMYMYNLLHVIYCS